MTKRKGIVSKVVLVLVVLTLISGCFVGTTLARYASQGSGSATTGIALWDIDFTYGGNAGAAAVTVADKLSPDITHRFSAESNNRVQYTGKKLVATIANNSDVNATITVTAGALQYKNSDGSDVAFNATGGSITANTIDAAASKAQADAVFDLKLYQNDSNGTDGAEEITEAFGLASKGTVYIFAEVTWTSQDQSSTEIVADAIDTWLGENVASIVSDLSYTAVQASEVPAGAGA